MSTPGDCSGGSIGPGTGRIAQRGLSRQTEGSQFLSSTTSFYRSLVLSAQR